MQADLDELEKDMAAMREGIAAHMQEIKTMRRQIRDISHYGMRDTMLDVMKCAVKAKVCPPALFAEAERYASMLSEHEELGDSLTSDEAMFLLVLRNVPEMRVAGVLR